jgi:CRISPR-associated endoribonuclease Cas6
MALLRLGWLRDESRPDLTTVIGRRVRLGSQFFTVIDAQEEFTPYTALWHGSSATQAMVRFLSATYFSRGGRWYPLPDPILLYAGLARRWNLFAPEYAVITESQHDALTTAVALSAHDVTSIPVDIGPGTRIGFTGHAAFTLTGRPDTREASRLLAALSLFALAAGVGAQTTHGLGAVEVSLT